MADRTSTKQLTLQTLTRDDIEGPAGSNEDTYLTISNLVADAPQEDIIECLPRVVSLISRGLTHTRDPFVYQSAVVLLSNTSRVVDEHIKPYCGDIIATLLKNLSDADLNRDLRVEILSCIGDIALALNHQIIEYLHGVMSTLEKIFFVHSGSPMTDQQAQQRPMTFSFGGRGKEIHAIISPICQRKENIPQYSC